MVKQILLIFLASISLVLSSQGNKTAHFGGDDVAYMSENITDFEVNNDFSSYLDETSFQTLKGIGMINFQFTQNNEKSTNNFSSDFSKYLVKHKNLFKEMSGLVTFNLGFPSRTSGQ